MLLQYKVSFDDIVPKILSLGAFGAVFLSAEKEVKPLIILLGLAVVGILGSLIGLFKEELLWQR